ncbi:hypothetical protein GQ600_22476 [Phytophthora cactorum]|nr:hypothetical protein GQ600_22476 [Phytophthora cactorum]
MSKLAGAASLETSGYLSRDLIPTATSSPISAINRVWLNCLVVAVRR